MTTKSYNKHKEYREYSTSGSIPYTDEQFDMIKSDLLPKGRLGTGSGDAEYHYEYREDRHPSGRYDRKDLRTVEQYSLPEKAANQSNSYYYKEEGTLPSVTGSSGYLDNTISSSPGYSKVKTTTKTGKEMNQNIEELDSLLDDLQRDQERQLYKGGYLSDTAESSSFDYRKTSTPVKPVSQPSSGYSTMKTAERQESRQWLSPGGTLETRSRSSSPIVRQKEITQQVYKEEKTESRIIPSQVSPAIPQAVPGVVCNQCYNPTGTLSRSSTPMNKVTTTVKTYTYEVPADQDPAAVPIPGLGTTTQYHTNTLNATNTLKTNTLSPCHCVTQGHTNTLNTNNSLSPCNCVTQCYTNTLNTNNSLSPCVGSPPSTGCAYCKHCNSRVSTTTQVISGTNTHAPAPAPVPLPGKETHIIRSDRYESTTNASGQPGYPPIDRSPGWAPLNDGRSPTYSDHPTPNGHGPPGNATYKWSETNFTTTHQTTGPTGGPPGPTGGPVGIPGPFPRTHTPTPSGEPPKRIDELLADFPDAELLPVNRQPDGPYRRQNAALQTRDATDASKRTPSTPAAPPVKGPPPVGSSRNVAGPAVYYPPGQEMFAKKEEGGSAAMQQAGGGHMRAKGKYMYEAEASSKSKHTETKTMVPVCLPLCCAMPCVLL